MKKKSVRMVALAMIVAMMATCFAGCKTKCDECGSTKDVTTIEIGGKKASICKDCLLPW